MIDVRKAADRGHFDHGWLNTYHTFSFADYYDPARMGFRQLRVINEDRVQSGRGFGTHAHQDMEIVTYVLEGALAHKDSLGNGSVIRPGDVQRMSAGTGVTHSEYNHSSSEIVHFLQIWILPERPGIAPSYEQKTFGDQEKRDTLRLIASHDGRDGSVTIHQDVEIYAAVLGPGKSVRLPLRPEHHAWVQVARGSVTLNGIPLQESDGGAVSGEAEIELIAGETAETLVFSLP